MAWSLSESVPCRSPTTILHSLPTLSAFFQGHPHPPTTPPPPTAQATAMGEENSATGAARARPCLVLSSLSTSALKGHRGEVISLDVLPAMGAASSPCLVASGGEDGTVRVWDVATGRAVRCFTGMFEDGEGVGAVAFLDAARLVAATSRSVYELDLTAPGVVVKECVVRAYVTSRVWFFIHPRNVPASTQPTHPRIPQGLPSFPGARRHQPAGGPPAQGQPLFGRGGRQRVRDLARHEHHSSPSLSHAQTAPCFRRRRR